MAETTKNDAQGGARRWYGAARGLALSFWAPFVCIASSLAFGFPYLPLIVAIIAAFVGALVPGRPHIGRSAWRIVREVMAWLFAAVHLAIMALWLYFATGAFDFVIIPVFRAAVCDADRIVIRDGGGLCHSKPDEEPSLFEITNKAEIASFNEMFKFSGRTMPCCCCGYPGIDWWRDGRRVVVSALHHGHALRVEGFVGDLRLTVVSSQRIQKWLEDNCGLTEDEGIPKYQYCRHERDIIEDAAQNWATAGLNGSRRWTTFAMSSRRMTRSFRRVRPAASIRSPTAKTESLRSNARLRATIDNQMQRGRFAAAREE